MRDGGLTAGRIAVLAGYMALLMGGAALGEEKGTPAEELQRRSYCVIEAGPGRVAACTTFGVVVYSLPPAGGEDVGPEVVLDAMDKKILLPDSVNDLYYRDGLLYAANGPAGVKIIEGVEGEYLRIAGEIETPGAAMAVAAVGNHLFVAMGVMGVGVYDVSDPTSLRALLSLDTEGYARNLHAEASGDGTVTLLVANGRGGVARFELSATMELVGAGRLACGGDVRQVRPFAKGYVLARGAGGVCYVARTLAQETLVCMEGRDFVRSVAVDGRTVYAGDGGAGIMLIDWPDVSKAGTARRFVPEHGSMNRVAVIGGRIAVAADYAGVLLIDPNQSRKEQ